MNKVILFLILMAGTLWAQTNAPTAADTNDVKVTAIDGYAARVDDTIITYGEVRESVMPYIQQASRRYQGQELVQRIQKAYVDGREALIEEALMKAEAKTENLQLPDHIIDNEVERLIRERFNNDRALLIRALAARRTTFEEWRQEVADQLTMRVFYGQEVTRRASISAQDVRKAYEQNLDDFKIPFKVKYRFILINKGSTEEDQAVKREQAENTLQKLRASADFQTVAKEVSEGDTSEIPWRELSDVRPEMRDALRNTPAGEVSDLIETDNEFYIIKVEERREEGTIPFEEVREQIENRLMQAERDRLHDELIKRLEAKHYVERY